MALRMARRLVVRGRPPGRAAGRTGATFLGSHARVTLEIICAIFWHIGAHFNPTDHELSAVAPAGWPIARLTMALRFCQRRGFTDHARASRRGKRDPRIKPSIPAGEYAILMRDEIDCGSIFKKGSILC